MRRNGVAGTQVPLRAERLALAAVEWPSSSGFTSFRASGDAEGHDISGTVERISNGGPESLSARTAEVSFAEWAGLEASLASRIAWII